MPYSRRRGRPLQLRPVQSVVLSFFAVSLVGWALLLLPGAGRFQPLDWFDALFLSVSTVCVTGLHTINLGLDVSGSGHVVVLILTQIGGLTYMVISTAFMALAGGRLPVARRIALRDAMGQHSLGGVMPLWRMVLQFTLACEGIGTLLLSAHFIITYDMPPMTALWLGLFHSVTAFCNGGVTLFGLPYYASLLGQSSGFNSLMGVGHDTFLLCVLMSLVILGGLGFITVLDLLERRPGRRLLLQTRVVLVSSVVLILVGWASFWLLEGGNVKTLGALRWDQRAVGALFQSVSPRTAGLATIDMAAMHPASKLLTMFLIIIGASPGGAGGGIKTTTFVIILLAALASMRGEEEIHVYHRRIAHTTVYRALAVGLSALVVVGLAIFCLTVTESNLLVGSAARELGSLLDIAFEAVSAFGTAGLSTGITSGLSEAGKVVLLLTMLVGRIGPVTLGLALIERTQRRHRQYPDGELMIG